MRECNECEVCCEFAEINEGDFYKSAFQKCKHQCNGCAIFGKPERPDVCNSYECSWLRGYGDEDDRPDKNGVMASITRMPSGLDFITIVELRTNAVLTDGKNMILDIINKVKLPALVFDYETPPPKLGDRVIIHKNLEDKCNLLKGEFLMEFDKDISIYKLRMSNG